MKALSQCCYRPEYSYIHRVVWYCYKTFKTPAQIKRTGKKTEDKEALIDSDASAVNEDIDYEKPVSLTWNLICRILCKVLVKIRQDFGTILPDSCI